jgi:hypothetical protein
MSTSVSVPRLFPGSPPSVPLSFSSSSSPPDFSCFTGQFSCCEYVQYLLSNYPSNISLLVSLPSDCDRDLFLYEHLRLLLKDLTTFCSGLSGVCTASSCPAMIATPDWEFLCAAHKQPRKCCAIDYASHALSGFSSFLSSGDMFPNRISIPAASAKQFTSVVRRLYRIFAHAFYHHRTEFDEFESKSHLAERFIALSLKFQLMDQSQLAPPIPFPESSPAYAPPPQ